MSESDALLEPEGTVTTVDDGAPVDNGQPSDDVPAQSVSAKKKAKEKEKVAARREVKAQEVQEVKDVRAKDAEVKEAEAKELDEKGAKQIKTERKEKAKAVKKEEKDVRDAKLAETNVQAAKEEREKRVAANIERTYKALGDIKVDSLGAVDGTYVWGNETPMVEGEEVGESMQRGADGIVRVAGMTELESLIKYCRGRFSIEQMAGPLPIRVPGTGSEHEGSYTILNKLYGTQVNVEGRGMYENVFSMFAPVARAVPPGMWVECSITFTKGGTHTVLMDMPSAIYITGCDVSDSPLTRLHESGAALFAIALSYPEIDNATRSGRTVNEVAREMACNNAEKKRGPKVACDMYAQMFGKYNELVAKMKPGRTMLVDYTNMLEAIRRGDPSDVPSETGLVLPTHEGGTAEPLTDENTEGKLPEDRLVDSVRLVVQTVLDDSEDAIAKARASDKPDDTV